MTVLVHSLDVKWCWERKLAQCQQCYMLMSLEGTSVDLLVVTADFLNI